MKKILVFALGILVFWIGCSSDKTEAEEKALASQPPNGENIFLKNCVLCHGADGKLEFNGAKDLTKSVVPLEDRITQITNGKKLMTPFNGILTEKQIKAVAKYTLTLNPNLKQ